MASLPRTESGRPRLWLSLGGTFVTQFNPGGLANELHDGVVQELSALLLQLETYQRKLESDPEGARADLDRIKTQARGTLKSLRQVIAHLREMESG
jgi:signal transduction histidine kinase